MGARAWSGDPDLTSWSRARQRGHTAATPLGNRAWAVIAGRPQAVGPPSGWSTPADAEQFWCALRGRYELELCRKCTARI
jgi:hypothetical protein